MQLHVRIVEGRAWVKGLGNMTARREEYMDEGETIDIPMRDGETLRELSVNLAGSVKGGARRVYYTAVFVSEREDD